MDILARIVLSGQAFAEAFDIHMSGEDCMYDCEIYENFKKSRDEEADK